MKFLFCGDRNWNRQEEIRKVMLLLLENFGKFTVIEGEAMGADRQSANAAVHLGLQVERYPADWDKYGKTAGPIRNRQMVNEGNPDAVFSFHDNLLSSKGTRDMVEYALKCDLPVWTSESGRRGLLQVIAQITDKEYPETFF
jgi:hypothetical protein